MRSEHSNRCREIAVARYLRASLLFLVLLAAAPAMAQVCINEFQASGSVLQDEDGDTPDWIELFNSASAAFSLSGWYLTDDLLFLMKWQFPNVSIPAGGYLIVFASGKDRRDPAGPLHTNFALRAEGEYLALVHPDGATVEQEFAPAYPPQKDGYSYGLLQTSATLATPGNPVKVLVPADASLGTSWTTTAFNESSSWTLGALPVGYTDRTLATADLLYVDVDAANPALGSLATWPNPGLMGDFVSGGSNPTVQTVNGAKAVSFNGANWLKTGTLTQADFTGNSNWSVEVWVCDSAIGDEECMVNWGHRGGPTGTGAQVNIGTNEYYGAVTHWDAPDMGYEGGLPAEGVWNHVVVTYEGGTNGIEKVYLNGDLNATEFKTINIHGPGDGQASPIILGAATWQTGLGATADDKWFTGALGKVRMHGGVLTADQVRNNYLADAERFKTDGAAGISLDVKSLMRGQNATAYLRIPFSAPGAGTYQSLELDIRYNDGFVAYVNGLEVARRNAPEPVGWNSVSSGTVQTSAWETINVSGALGVLTPSGNVLAIQGLNHAADDVDFLIDARVRAASLGFGDPKYFHVPTPGAVNSGSFTDFVEATVFSVSRGFYDAPFTVEISTATPGATIRYTTDASWPSETHGTLYTAPVSITKTTTLRAIAYLSGFKSSDVVTHTYIFRDNIMTQTRPADYPTQTYDPGYQLDYDVDQDVIGPASPYGSVYRNRFKSDLLALPTLSIVMDVNDLFGLAGGIYANSNRDGEAWERAGSFEWIDPDTSPTTVQVNCGVRIQGGWGRNAFESPKHNLRFKFRTVYGPGKLRCKLFPDSPVDQFDQLTLRSQTHDSWTTAQNDPGWWSFRSNATYGKDSWHRQTQRDMGHPSVRGRFCHVYLNGLYWGMYELDERPNAAFMASYEGGDEEDYDAIGSGILRDGDREAWDQMFRIANGAGPHGSLSNDAAYQDMKNCLDVVNLADYVILNIYSGITDWPGWNYYAVRRRVPPGLFRILCWDSEASMTGAARLFYNKLSEGGFNDGVGHLFVQCKQNAEFRMMVADRIYRHLLMPGGALTPARNASRWQDVIAQLEPGMVGESARWGDCWQHPPLLPDNAKTKSDWVLNTFIPQRSPTVVGFFRNYGVCPGTNPPTFNQQGGKVDQGFEVTLTNPNASGTIYYTTDGSDPRAPTALIYTPGNPIAMDQTTQIKARVLKGLEWSALNEAVFQVALTLVDYWSFNDTVSLLRPTYATGTATLEVAPGPASEVTDSTGQDFSGVNAQLGEAAGSHLRINNPLGSTVTLSMPTTGFQALVFKYEARRSGQGAGVQELSYTTDGATFLPLGTVTVLDDVPVLQTFDLTAIAAVNDNPLFAIRIAFSQGSGGTGGNNRFDNITLEGVPIPTGNQPPSVKPLAGFLRAVEGEAAVTVDLKTLFSDPNGDPLIYNASVGVDREAYVLVNVAADTLELRGLQRGEATITVGATDGKSSPVATPIRLLIYPAPYHLSDGAYRFDQWAPGTPELIYPSHMLFLQSNVSDPGVSAPLDYAYYIPADDYAPTDVVGYPYQNASRTRINGLGVDGISFVNTGRMRDLGGALLALDTTGQSQVSLRWMGGTLLRNSRVYAIRLQYRVGTSGTFLDLLDAGAPVEYMVHDDAHVQALGPIMLPPALLNQPHVQLLWRYYYLSGDTGSRAQLTLDNIEAGTGGNPPSEPADADPGTWPLY